MASTTDKTCIIFLGGEVHVAEDDSSAAIMITIVDCFQRPKTYRAKDAKMRKLFWRVWKLVTLPQDPLAPLWWLIEHIIPLAPTTVDHPTAYYYSSLGARQLDGYYTKRSAPLVRKSWFQQPSFLSQLSPIGDFYSGQGGGRADSSRLVAVRARTESKTSWNMRPSTNSNDSRNG
jgi:hypothetical protein